MDKRKKNKIKRSALTGKIINGKEAILLDEVKEYLKKQGYEIIEDEDKIYNMGTIINKLKKEGFKIIQPNLVSAIEVYTVLFLTYSAFFYF